MELRIQSHGSLHWNPEAVRLWNEVASRSGRPDPFCCTPAWQMAFHDAFSPSRRLLLHVEEGNVLAFAEMALSSGRPCLVPLESHWLSGCPLLGPDAEELFAWTCALLPRVYGNTAPAFLISGLEKDAPLLVNIQKRFETFFRFLPQPVLLQRSASLEGGMDGYLSRRSANFRAKMKKARRRADAGGVLFERFLPSTPEEADAVYARMLAVEEKSWKGRGHCGMTETPSRQFYHAMIRRLALYRGGRVMFAVHDGTDIGFIFGGMAGPYYRGQQFSYDAAWKSFSIGDLLQMEQLGWLCEENAIRYDMGMSDIPAMAYKTRWAEKEQALTAWLLLPYSH